MLEEDIGVEVTAHSGGLVDEGHHHEAVLSGRSSGVGIVTKVTNEIVKAAEVVLNHSGVDSGLCSDGCGVIVGDTSPLSVVVVLAVTIETASLETCRVAYICSREITGKHGGANLSEDGAVRSGLSSGNRRGGFQLSPLVGSCRLCHDEGCAQGKS